VVLLVVVEFVARCHGSPESVETGLTLCHLLVS
jgi:hypothetical protein